MFTGNLAFRLQDLFAMINKISRNGFLTVTVAQWVRRWSSGHRVVQAEGSSPGGDTYHIFFSAVIFISVLLQGLVDFSDIVILCSRSNSCCQ